MFTSEGHKLDNSRIFGEEEKQCHPYEAMRPIAVRSPWEQKTLND